MVSVHDAHNARASAGASAAGERVVEARDRRAQVVERPERFGDGERLAPDHDGPRAASHLVPEQADERRLPDARLAGDEHERATSRLGGGDRREETRDLGLALEDLHAPIVSRSLS